MSLTSSHLRLGGEPLVLITVVCPSCKASYEVQDSLRGKSMRCPQPTCRKVFLVDDAPAPPPSAPKTMPAIFGPASSQMGGSVGDLIPLLPAEDVESRPPAKDSHIGDFLELLPAEVADPEPLPLEVIQPDTAVPAPDWSSPPPVRRTPKAPEPVEESPPPRKP